MFADVKADNPENVASIDPEQTEWGYDLYPERRGKKYEPSMKKILLGMEGRESTDNIKCEKNVFNCIQNSKIVKLMMGALKSSGW